MRLAQNYASFFTRPLGINLQPGIPLVWICFLIWNLRLLPCLAQSVAFDETGLGKVYPGAIPPSFVASADFRHFAYVVVEQGKMFVVHGDRKHGPYEGVGEGSPIITSDGSSIAYVTVDKERSTVIVRGKAEKEYEEIQRLQFSKDGKTVAYNAFRGGKWRVVINGVEGPEFDLIGVGDPEIAVSTNRVVYAGKRNGKWVIVDNHNPSEEMDAVGRGSTYFSRDGKTLVYLGVQDKSFRVFRNGIAGKAYESVSDLVISDQGEVLYRAVSGTNQMVILNEKTHGQHAMVVQGSLGLSRDGKRLAYAEAVGLGMRMIVDGTPGGKFQELSSPLFSSNGQRVAYKAVRDLDSYVILDGKPSPDFSSLSSEALSFSPNGSKIGYTAEKSARWHIVVNDKLDPAFDGIGVGTFAFSHDNSHWAYWAKQGIRAVLVVDGKASKPYRAYLGKQPIHFDENGVGHALAIQGDELIRITASSTTGRPE